MNKYLNRRSLAPLTVYVTTTCIGRWLVMVRNTCMRAPAGPIHSTLRAKTILRHQQSSTGHVVLYVRTHAALQLASCNKSTTAVEGGQSTIGPHEPWPKKKKKVQHLYIWFRYERKQFSSSLHLLYAWFGRSCEVVCCMSWFD